MIADVHEVDLVVIGTHSALRAGRLAEALR
jgi:nucleotide-binding universal stress UspA family protein